MLNHHNHRLIKALLRQPVDRTPVWIMRQAGRYLPEYRQLRAKTPNFMQFCKTPELAAEATLQPLARFALDAAIIFSDILTIPDAMGVELEVISGQGPVIQNPIRHSRDIEQLRKPDIADDLGYVMDAIKLTVKALDAKVPLIGFAGSPWTMATYMVEGGSSRIFQMIKTMMYREPKLLHTLLQRLTDIVIDYLNAQIDAGAEVIMLFDSWGGVLTKAAFKEFSLRYLQQIAENIKRSHNGHKIPLIFFTKNGGQWLELLADTNCDALGLDWTVDLADARRRVGDQVALQGNLDPMLLFAKPEKIREEVATLIKQYGPGEGHVFNLGHGIHKDTPPEHVAVMVDAVHELSVQHNHHVAL